MLPSLVKASPRLPWQLFLKSRFPPKYVLSMCTTPGILPAHQLKSRSFSAATEPKKPVKVQLGKKNLVFRKALNLHYRNYEPQDIVMHQKEFMRNGFPAKRIFVYGKSVENISKYVKSLNDTLSSFDSYLLLTINAALAVMERENRSTRYVHFRKNKAIDIVNLCISPVPLDRTVDLQEIKTLALPTYLTLHMQTDASVIQEIENSMVYNVDVNKLAPEEYVLSGNVTAMAKATNWLFYKNILPVYPRNAMFSGLPEAKIVRGREMQNRGKALIPFLNQFQRNFIRSCHYSLKPWKMDRQMHFLETDNAIEVEGNAILVKELDDMVKEAFSNWTEISFTYDGDPKLILTKESSLALNGLYPKTKLWLERGTNTGVCYGFPPEDVQRLADYIQDYKTWQADGELQSKDKGKLDYVKFHFLQRQKDDDYSKVIWCTSVRSDEALNKYTINFLGDAAEVKANKEMYEAMMENIVSCRLTVPADFAFIPILRGFLSFYMKTYHNSLGNVLKGDYIENELTLEADTEESMLKAKEIITNEVFRDRRAKFIGISEFRRLTKIRTGRKGLLRFVDGRVESHPDVKAHVWSNYGVGIFGKTPEAVAKYLQDL